MGTRVRFRAAGLLLHLSLLLLLLLLLLSLGVKHCSASYRRVYNCYAVTRVLVCWCAHRHLHQAAACALHASLLCILQYMAAKLLVLFLLVLPVVLVHLQALQAPDNTGESEKAYVIQPGSSVATALSEGERV